MSLVRKFEFGQSFDKPAQEPVVVDTAAFEPEPPPPPTYSQAELDEAEHRGFMNGRLEGNRLALERQEHQVALAIADIAGILPTLTRGMAAAVAVIERDAATTLLLAAERLFPRLIAETDTNETALLLERAFHKAVEEPRITIRCPVAVRDAVERLVKEAATDAGYTGKLTIISDPTLSEGGCRVEWSEGGLERDPASLLAAIESALRRGLDTTPHHPAPREIEDESTEE